MIDKNIKKLTIFRLFSKEKPKKIYQLDVQNCDSCLILDEESFLIDFNYVVYLGESSPKFYSFFNKESEKLAIKSISKKSARISDRFYQFGFIGYKTGIFFNSDALMFKYEKSEDYKYQGSIISFLKNGQETLMSMEILENNRLMYTENLSKATSDSKDTFIVEGPSFDIGKDKRYL